MIPVDVLVLTYKRPALLADTLRSLAGQRLPWDIRMGVIVVDNDRQQSGRAIVEEFRSRFRDIRYVCEPQANVAIARNRALREARGVLVAFMDDDEIAAPDWLASLLKARRWYEAQIVCGPVLPKFVAAAPRWVKRGRFFDRPRFATGTAVAGGTGNVLLDLAAVRRVQVTFDPAYGKSGGEDTQFFHNLRAAGLRCIWCDEAVVHEQVQRERMRVRWLVRRAFQGGHSFARIHDAGRFWPQRAKALLYSSAALAFLFMVPLAACTGFASALRMSQRCARHLGRGAALWRTFSAAERGSDAHAIAH